MAKNEHEERFERICEAMRDAKMKPTQKGIAALVGISQASVHGWKTGCPSMDSALTLAKKLNVCVEWILTGKGPKRPGTPADPTSQKLWDLWAGIPAAGRSELVGYAASLVRPTQRKVS